VDTWILLKRVLRQVHHLDSDKVLDYIAVYDILKECCSGKSNSYISQKLEIDEEYIESCIKEFFGFCGFRLDLDFDCRVLYNRYRYNKYIYLDRATALDPVTDYDMIKKSFQINERLDQIEKEIEKYYANC